MQLTWVQSKTAQGFLEGNVGSGRRGITEHLEGGTGTHGQRAGQGGGIYSHVPLTSWVHLSVHFFPQYILWEIFCWRFATIWKNSQMNHVA